MKINLKIFLLLIPILIFLSNNSLATVDTTGKNFALQNNAERRKTGYYYISTDNSVKPVAKIVESNSAGTVQKNQNNEIGIYSINNGTGISSNKSIKKVEKYNQYFGLEEYRNISSIYRYGLPNNDVTYNQLAWILNNICTPENELSKQSLLLSAGIEPNTFKNYQIGNYEKEDIEKDIIEVIQQAAIWYITNPRGEYHPTDFLQLYVSQDLSSATNLSEMNLPNGENPINKLYAYLINGAISSVQNGYNYTAEAKKSPINFNKESASVDVYGNEHVIGPYNISLGQTNCTLDVSISNGAEEIRDVKLLGEDMKQELVGDTISDKIISNMGKNFYIAVPTTTSANKININIKSNYNEKKLTYWNTNPNIIKTSEPIVVIKTDAKTNVESDSKQIKKTSFDLALRQFIETVNDESPEKIREPEYKRTDLKSLADGSSSVDNGTTLVKKSKKDGLNVDTNDRVLLTIRIYNEGQNDGKADVIGEFLPEGLEFIEDSEINSKYRWTKYNDNKRILLSDYLKDTTIKGFNSSIVGDEYKIDYQDIKIECKVTTKTQTTDVSLKAIAEILSSSNLENIADRDSSPNNLTNGLINDYNPGTSSEGKGYEDDDDYEELIVRGKYFDLALKSFISEVEDPSGNRREIKREPKVDVAPLVGGGQTANYFGNKGPVSIEAGDIIIYTIRVYNEGQMDGYVDEVTYHLPEEMEYVNDEYNAQFGWIIDTTDATQRTLKSSVYSHEKDEDNYIKAFDLNSEKMEYKEFKLKCKVKSTAQELKEITGIVEISKTYNKSGLADRDNKSNVTLPSDKDLENYRGNDSNKAELTDHNYYYKGQEDDDDFDKVVLEKFDLALRYFITEVNGVEVDSREPVVDTSIYGETADNNVITSFKYNHSKDEVKTCNNDEVTFKIRVYNEGTQDGYATQIGSNLPTGMAFLTDNEVNQKYKWKMLDDKGKETEDPGKAIYVKTDYLAKQENVEEDDDNIIKAFNSDGEINYKDVKLVLKVAKANSRDDRIITPQAQIIQATDADGGKVNDVDSSANSWQDGDDDQDEEKIYVKFFDLSVNMNVDKVITIEDGRENISETTPSLHKETEPIVNVSVNEKNIDNLVIKYKFKIEVKNEGEIPGTASLLSDYLPEGMRFNQADNVRWQEKEGVLSTDELNIEDIDPGDSRTVYLTLSWINGESNIGVKKNVIEISEIKNASNSEDVDSIQNNRNDSEDDISSALISITSMAGGNKQYMVGIIAVITLVIIGIGIVWIKKYVL